MSRVTHPPVVSVTDAPVSGSDDSHDRMVRYLALMGIRVVCFVLAVLVLHGWLRWVAVVAAVVLPYIAVVLANARRGGDRRGRPDFGPSPAPKHEIGR